MIIAKQKAQQTQGEEGTVLQKHAQAKQLAATPISSVH